MTSTASVRTSESASLVPAQAVRSVGHLALHFRPGEAEIATRFFRLLGARVSEYPNQSSDEPLYIVALDSADPDRADNIIFLFSLKPAQIELERAIGEALGAGTSDEHPALKAFLDHRSRWPESYLHFGLHFAELGELEAAVLRIRTETAADPAFGARVDSIQLLKARGGDGDYAIAKRMAESPVFSGADAFAYGRHAVQVHIRTDLFATGLAMFGSVVELDYVFTGPGRERNPFNWVAP
ncbi:hypothetical protein EAS64_25330 [Trebonia kvetii]|uniref:Uncharacterized protein n=1 Tax=Trebonia kvetii TaxID=2480626 RepID=A0A6P2BTD5_9ACTN|nr:hypothetical protein [Trebonia kvetii]TVZ02158.1 hypothetical protein EAS64_25330 [Trebonia kvetii]